MVLFKTLFKCLKWQDQGVLLDNKYARLKAEGQLSVICFNDLLLFKNTLKRGEELYFSVSNANAVGDASIVRQIHTLEGIIHRKRTCLSD